MKTITIQKAESFEKFNDARNFTINLAVHGPEEMDASDGYHTFKELYDHRITLYIALCQLLKRQENAIGFIPVGESFVWRSKKHSDGEICFGTGTQFVLGIGKEKGKQITYHLPIEKWDETNFAETLETAPEWDSHTPEDVLERLKNL
jgi:hypothetical protein